MSKTESYKKFEKTIEELDALKKQKEKEGDFAAKEAYAKDTGRALEASYWEQRRSLWKKLEKEKILFGIRNGFKLGEVIFEKSKTAKMFYKFLRSVIEDWLLAQYKFEGEPVNIESEVDHKLPFRPEDGMDYLSYLHYWITPLGFIYKEFGEEVRGEIEAFLAEMAAFYSESGKVFKKAQTTIAKPDTQNVVLRFARSAAKPLNMLPSLHVQMVGHTLCGTNRILAEREDNPNEYFQFKKDLFEKGVRILETCLTTKQHGVRDVAAGFVALSSRNPGFDQNLVKLIIDRMFAKPVEERTIDPAVAQETRAVIFSIYQELAGKVKDENRHYTEVLIEFIKSLINQ